MAIVIQHPGSSGSYAMGAMSQISSGYLEGKKAQGEAAERKAKLDYYAEQTREKKLKSDQIEAYNLAVGNLGKGTGVPGEKPVSDGQDWYRQTHYWQSAAAKDLREAQESGAGSYPDEIMQMPSVQEAMRDSEAVLRSYNISLLRNPLTGGDALDQKDYDLVIDRQDRAVRSAINIETGLLKDRKMDQFISEMAMIKDEQLHSVYEDKLQAAMTKTGAKGGSGDLGLLGEVEALRDEYYEQVARKDDYARWSKQAEDYLDDEGAITALAAYLEQEQLESKEYYVNPRATAMDMLRAVQGDTITEGEANNPADAITEYDKAKEKWNKIQIAINPDIDGVSRKDFESQAEHLENGWSAAVGFQRAFSSDRDDAKAFVAQLRHIRDTIEVPPQYQGKHAASYRLSAAADKMNETLERQRKSAMPRRFLYSLLEQSVGTEQRIEEVSDENWLLDTPRPTGEKAETPLTAYDPALLYGEASAADVALSNVDAEEGSQEERKATTNVRHFQNEAGRWWTQDMRGGETSVAGHADKKTGEWVPFKTKNANAVNAFRGSDREEVEFYLTQAMTKRTPKWASKEGGFFTGYFSSGITRGKEWKEGSWGHLLKEAALLKRQAESRSKSRRVLEERFSN